MCLGFDVEEFVVDWKILDVGKKIWDLGLVRGLTP